MLRPFAAGCEGVPAFGKYEVLRRRLGYAGLLPVSVCGLAPQPSPSCCLHCEQHARLCASVRRECLQSASSACVYVPWGVENLITRAVNAQG